MRSLCFLEGKLKKINGKTVIFTRLGDTTESQ